VNRAYKTVRQKHLANRQLDYFNGTGLGGSSIINFQFWTVGPKGDYEEWAERVDDQAFNWENAQRLFKKIESFDLSTVEGKSKYVSPSAYNHGQSGAVNVEFEKNLTPEHTKIIDGVVAMGLPRNLDINSGNPIGVGVPPNSSKRGYRVTAKLAYLSHPLPNLEIKTSTSVDKILWDGNRAIGVETANGSCKCTPFTETPICLDTNKSQIWHPKKSLSLAAR